MHAALCAAGAWLTWSACAGQAAAAKAATDASRAKAERARAQLAAEERRLEALRRLRGDEEAAAALLQVCPVLGQLIML